MAFSFLNTTLQTNTITVPTGTILYERRVDRTKIDAEKAQMEHLTKGSATEEFPEPYDAFWQALHGGEWQVFIPWKVVDALKDFQGVGFLNVF